MNRFIFFISLCGLLLFMSGCAVDTSGLGRPGSFVVEPRYFCPEETVTLHWDLSTLPRKDSHCEDLGPINNPPMACSTESECADGGADSVCLDGYCCSTALHMNNACPNEQGCYPPFTFSVTADTVIPESLVTGETESIRGRQVVTPPDSTAFTATLEFDEETVNRTETTELVRLTPPSSPVLDFPFTCAGATPTWVTLNMDSPRFAGDNVRIMSLRNTTRHFILLSNTDPGIGPIVLEPGQRTDEFNGPIRGTWTARLSSLDRASLVIPRCDATNITDPWPDLAVQVNLECADPDADP